MINLNKHLLKRMRIAVLVGFSILFISFFWVVELSSEPMQTDEQENNQPSQRTVISRFDDSDFDDEFQTRIQVRRPERDLIPRTETEEITFSLNFIRQRFIESNRRLY